MTVTLGDAVARARRRLAAAPFRPPGREALLLAGHVLGWGEAQVLARPERVLSEAERSALEALVERRLTGEPVAYLVGEKEFWGRRFAVDRRVLIPRPETEHLVEAALGLPLSARPRVLDIGTGSGCLAITLALELPAARVVGTDRSPAALAVARANARRHLGAMAPGRLTLAAADLLAGLTAGRFDLVISNPPYIDPADADELSPEIRRFEPHLALFSPPRGDRLAGELIAGAATAAPRATLLLEIGRGQLEAIGRHAECNGYSLGAVIEDYGGIARVVRLDPARS